jgi:hypothetical protein
MSRPSDDSRIAEHRFNQEGIHQHGADRHPVAVFFRNAVRPMVAANDVGHSPAARQEQQSIVRSFTDPASKAHAQRGVIEKASAYFHHN